MFYFENVKHPLSILEKTLDQFFSSTNEELAIANQAIFERYFFISLYTIWETYMTETIAGLYISNEKILESDSFEFYYYDNIFSSRNLKEKIRKQGTSALKNIQPDFIFSSNNLWFNSIKEIFKAYNFDNNSLECYFSQNSDVSNDIKQLLGAIDLSEVENIVNVPKIKRTDYHEIQLYINFLVHTRNTLAHRYTSPYPKYDRNTMEGIISLFRNIFSCFDKYIKDQILEKTIQSKSEFTPFKIVDLVADKKASEMKMKIIIESNEDVELNKQTHIIFYEDGKPIHQKFKIFKVIQIDGNDTVSSSNIKLKKNISHQLLIESLFNCGGMKKNRSYNIFIE